MDGGSRACELFDCGAQASRSGDERARCPRGPVVLNEEGWCSFGAMSHGPEAKDAGRPLRPLFPYGLGAAPSPVGDEADGEAIFRGPP